MRTIVIFIIAALLCVAGFYIALWIDPDMHPGAWLVTLITGQIVIAFRMIMDKNIVFVKTGATQNDR